MPAIERVDRIDGTCGASGAVNPDVAYCTTTNTILVSDEGAAHPAAAYLVAHSFGHAVQVRHGVADVALQTIRARRSEETKLRGWVERQVDCIAGYLVGRAGAEAVDVNAFFENDPFDNPHWGRNPLSRGPHVPVPPAERQQWFTTGMTEGLAACGVGEFGPELLLQAVRR